MPALRSIDTNTASAVGERQMFPEQTKQTRTVLFRRFAYLRASAHRLIQAGGISIMAKGQEKRIIRSR
jgi:hypothetical protein